MEDFRGCFLRNDRLHLPAKLFIFSNKEIG